MSRKRRPITDAEIATMRQMYQDGHTMKDIALELGRNKSSVRQYLISGGLLAPQRRRAITHKDHRVIVEMYSRGETIADIRKKTGCSYGTIYKCVEEHGVPLRSPELAGGKKYQPAKRAKVADPLPPHEIAATDVRRLLISVLQVAAEDARTPQHRNDALEFFGSRWYRHIMTALDLPPNLLPEGVRLEAA